uniref:Uncharacterized protein n=1 Tax=Anguilla anguilla TaxID=7936 RepID=A0A0E9R3W9_ANGAN
MESGRKNASGLTLHLLLTQDLPYTFISSSVALERDVQAQKNLPPRR